MQDNTLNLNFSLPYKSNKSMMMTKFADFSLSYENLKNIFKGETFENENFKFGHFFTVEMINYIEIKDFEKFLKKIKGFIKINWDYQSAESDSQPNSLWTDSEMH